MIDLDSHFMAIASLIANRGECRRRKVGAVIFGPDGVIISTGYNGAPTGTVRGCVEGACPRGLLTEDQLPAYANYNEGPGRCIAVHAEARAILSAERDRLPGSTIVVTDEPCYGCQKLIAEVQIERIVTPNDLRTNQP